MWEFTRVDRMLCLEFLERTMEHGGPSATGVLVDKADAIFMAGNIFYHPSFVSFVENRLLAPAHKFAH